jgi:hypothetical protein
VLRSKRRLVALAPGGLVLLDLPLRKRHAELLAADAGEDWRPAAAALRAHCEQHALRGACLQVLLSQAFVRFLVAPWSMALTSPASAAAYLCALFDATHGTRASGWSCTTEERIAEEPRIAAGVERALIDELAASASACGARLGGVAPWIVPAFARERRRLKRAAGWYAAIEPGWITLAALRGGRIEEVSRAAFEGAAEPALERALRRQSLRQGIEAPLPVWTAGRADSIDAWPELAA